VSQKRRRLPLYTISIVPPTFPEIFLFYEIWASREAQAAHKQTPFLRWNARKDTLLASRESTFWRNLPSSWSVQQKLSQERKPLPESPFHFTAVNLRPADHQGTYI
jgi:hypothetical protein